MQNRNIIVIGASAGGFEAIKQLVRDLPGDLQAALFIVWHMSPDVRGVLPDVLNKQNTIPAAHAIDREPIAMNRIYVAPPDRHLLLEKGVVRITRGPRENRFRPAIDPLFRSAAYYYGPRVIGVILSGSLDDGTAGLWSIKNRGGIAVVQDPKDAEVPSMPENAIREVNIDYIVPLSGMAELLVRLSDEKVNTDGQPDNERMEIEVNVAKQDKALQQHIMKLGNFSPYTCPECHGVLIALHEGGRTRYRCHTGHSFSADSLLASITENIEDSLWNAIRSIEESVMLLNHMGDHFAEHNETRLAAMYFKKAKEAHSRAEMVRNSVLQHEQLSTVGVQQQAEASTDK